MEAHEKVAYLQGLLDGLPLDSKSDAGRLFAAVADALSAVSGALKRLDESGEVMNNAVADISEELEEIHTELQELREGFEDAVAAADHGGGEDFLCEVVCPSCEKKIGVSEDMVEKGEINCPHCGEELELDSEADSGDNGD